MLSRCTLAICLALLVTTGCSKDQGPRTVPAEGVVTLDGQPVEGAAVVFVSDGGNYSAMGMSDAEGKFSLDAFEYKTGAIPGKYFAIVTRTVEITSESPEVKGEEAEHAAENGEAVQMGVKNDMPQKYGQPSPDFQFTIPEDGTQDLKLDLVSK